MLPGNWHSRYSRTKEMRHLLVVREALDRDTDAGKSQGHVHPVMGCPRQDEGLVAKFQRESYRYSVSSAIFVPLMFDSDASVERTYCWIVDGEEYDQRLVSCEHAVGKSNV